MSVNTIEISLMGRSYQLACPADQAERVRLLAQMVEEKMRVAVSSSQGAVGEVRSFLLAGLMLADEVLEAKASEAKALEKVQQSMNDEEDLLVAAVEHLTTRINTIAARVEGH